jgi:hypothetical protein
MMRTFLLPITAVFLLAACTASSPSEAEIKDAIVEANYCETADDCVDVGGKCPFDCYIFVNEAEADRIGAMVEWYQSTCTYSCLAINGVDCINNTCQPQLDPPERVSDDGG